MSEESLELAQIVLEHLSLKAREREREIERERKREREGMLKLILWLTNNSSFLEIVIPILQQSTLANKQGPIWLLKGTSQRRCLLELPHLNT